MPAFDRQAEYFKGGGFAGAEAYCDPPPNARPARRVRSARRQARAARQGLSSAADYVELGLLRAAFQREVEALLAPFDAFLMPTRAVRRADHRRGRRQRRGLFPLERAASCATRPGQFPRRLRRRRCPATRRAARRSASWCAAPAMTDRRILAVAAAVEARARPGLTGAPRAGASSARRRPTRDASRLEAEVGGAHARAPGLREARAAAHPRRRQRPAAAACCGKRYPRRRGRRARFLAGDAAARARRGFVREGIRALSARTWQRLPLARRRGRSRLVATWRCTGWPIRCRRCASSRACWRPRGC